MAANIRPEVVVIDFAGFLAKLTHTRAKDWKEVKGPDTRCGVDYWYEHPKKGTVWVNYDQGMLTVHGGYPTTMLYYGMVEEDETYGKYFKTT